MPLGTCPNPQKLWTLERPICCVLSTGYHPRCEALKEAECRAEVPDTLSRRAWDGDKFFVYFGPRFVGNEACSSKTRPESTSGVEGLFAAPGETGKCNDRGCCPEVRDWGVRTARCRYHRSTELTLLGVTLRPYKSQRRPTCSSVVGIGGRA